MCVCVGVWVLCTIHKSLQALHQGLDGAGQVPRVLLDVLVDDIATATRRVLRLAELCSRKVCVSLVSQGEYVLIP